MEEFALITEIVERAKEKDLLASDKLSLTMDLDCVSEKYNLDLQALLKADDFNFAHDVVGIQNHLNRRTRELEDFFLPRYAR